MQSPQGIGSRGHGATSSSRPSAAAARELRCAMTARADIPANVAPPAVFVAAASVLGWLAGPAVGVGDAGELGAAARTLGVPHPTGFPVEMIALHGAGWLPLGPAAWRQNVAIALAGAACLALLCALVVRLARSAGFGRVGAGAGGVVGAAFLGGWATFLASALQVEVYVSALLVVLLAGGYAVRRPGRLAPLAVLAGLTMGMHVSARMGLAVIFVASWIAVPRGRRLKSLLPAAALALIASLIVLYLPLASLRDPPLDWGDPETAGRLWAHLSAARIRRAFEGAMFDAPGAALAQFGRHLAELWPLALPFGVGVRVLARRRHAPIGMVMAALLALDVAYLALIHPMGVELRQVGHLSGAVVALFGGVGTAHLVHVVADGRVRTVFALGCAALLAAAAMVRVPPGALAPGYVLDVFYGGGGALSRVPARSLVLCTTDDVCAAGLFARYANGVRPDVAFAPSQHLWEPSIRRTVGTGLRPPLELEGRPSTDRGRHRLAQRAVRALLRGEHGRPLLFEASKALRGVQHGLVVSRTPPWLAPRHGTAASEAGFGAVEVLDRMRANGLQPLDTAGARARGVVSRAYGRVGSAALSRGETAQASLAFHRATRIAPSRAAAWTNLGVARWRAGQRRAALEATRRAVSIEPSRATPWVNLVRFLLASGDVQAARRAHRAARRAGVEDPRLGRLGQRLDVP